MTKAALHTQALTSQGGAITLLRRRLRLRVVAGPDKKTDVRLDLDRIVVGTHESCDLRLSDETVSRQHFEIVLVPRGYLVRDLDSRNGTVVGEMRLGEVTVTDKVKIRAGATHIELVPTDEDVQIELSPQVEWGELKGRSPAMRRVFELLAKVARTDTTVLITGESGTGKEVAARSIHQHSRRKDQPFVVVDCAALPANLIESELYGHERGAFTGATQSRPGAFVAANGGTVFLDELGELPLDLQTRLLGVLERRHVQPLGSSKAVPVDVRVVAATNRDLRAEVNRGNFRSDLYFRLAVVPVHMPPLRERPEDVDLYVEAFLDEWADAGMDVTITADLIERLKKRDWPGNVRELRNVLQSALTLGELPGPGPCGSPSGPPASGPADSVAAPSSGPSSEIDPNVPFKVGKAALIENYERAYLAALMEQHGGNITRAARGAEIDRVYLLRLLDRHGMRKRQG